MAQRNPQIVPMIVAAGQIRDDGVVVGEQFGAGVVVEPVAGSNIYIVTWQGEAPRHLIMTAAGEKGPVRISIDRDANPRQFRVETFLWDPSYQYLRARPSSFMFCIVDGRLVDT